MLNPRNIQRTLLLAALACAGPFAQAQTAADANAVVESILSSGDKSPYPAWATQAGPIARIPFRKYSASVSLTDDQFQGSMVASPATDGVMELSLDDAVNRALAANLALKLRHEQQRIVHGEFGQGVQTLLPSITASASTALTEENLVTLGFKPAVFAGLLPAGVTIPGVINYQNSSVQANLEWQAFSIAALRDYQAAKEAVKFTAEDTADARQTVVLRTAEAYLQVLAAESNLANAQALLKADQSLFDNTVAEHQAGIVANLDELRAHVQLAQQQQVVIARQNDLDKKKIALNRMIGLDTGQQTKLTDTVPYAELDAQPPLAELRETAWHTRQDYLGAQQQLRAAELLVSAAKAERLPTLSFGGYYGVIGITYANYHGNFAAQANLNLPIFNEAKLRGDREVAEARVAQGRAAADNLKQQIDADLRNASLDYDSAKSLVAVARSNVDLAQTALDEANQRYAAGVADDLASVDAQATLASAQNQLVTSEYQYNLAKLELARALGVVDAQYRVYLGQK